MNTNSPPATEPTDATIDKQGAALHAQRFQMLEDIARELAGPVVFPTYFDAAFRLRKELQNPDLTIPRIAAIVSVEPLVATRLMQLAGSALYSPDGSGPRDLQSAINRLGVDVVRSTALAIAMNQLMRSKETAVFSEFTKTLWDHSLRAAVASRVLARTHTRINPDEAMLAGLVHDLGAFYMIYRAAQYEELRIRPDSVKHLILQWHENIALTLLASLGVPEDVVNATADHDQPRALPETIRTLADIVYVGNLLAGAHVIWSGVGPDPMRESVQLACERYAELLPDIDEGTAAMLSVFS